MPYDTNTDDLGLLGCSEALIALRIIGELDEAGYLLTDLRQVADELGIPLAEAERALATVQSLDRRHGRAPLALQSASHRLGVAHDAQQILTDELGERVHELMRDFQHKSMQLSRQAPPSARNRDIHSEGVVG